jgi:CelD/BcsL family acetyltransferase involved in cellulose biosynthesis
MRPACSQPVALRVSTVDGLEGLRGIEGEWTALLQKTDNTLPFLLPEWLATWWDVFHQDRLLLRDSLRVKVVRRDSGELVGVVPLMLTERPRVGPVRSRVLGFLGADRYITEQRAPILARGCEREIARALATDLLAENAWNWVAWEGLQRDSEFALELERALPLRWGAHDTAHLLTMARTWDEFRGGLKRNIKESLRRCYNSLKRDNLEPRLSVAESRADVGRALETFFDLHTARSRQVETVGHPDRFADPRARRFLVQVCAHLADRGIARVFTLHVDGRAVAARIGFQLPGCLYLYYSGFDPAWSKYSVMTTAVAEALKYAIERRIPRVHLSMGIDTSKSRWGPETVQYEQAIWVKPGVASTAALRLYSWGRSDGRVRRALDRFLPKRYFD